MATHNQVRLVGYVKGKVNIYGSEETGARAFFTIRTLHRDLDMFKGEVFEDIMIFYDGESERIMSKIQKLEPFDIVDIKGVFNILTMNKRSVCPVCGKENIKMNSSSTFVYPIHLMKLNALYHAYECDHALPEEILTKHYKEISNQAIIVGTVVKDPELKMYKKELYCKFPLGVNRKYYIKSQDCLTADYPWVYTFGSKAEEDVKHLIKDSTVMLDCFIRTRRIESQMVCEECGAEYTFPDTSTEFIPYSMEYLKDYLTDEDIAKIENEKRVEKLNQAEKNIFGN